MTIEEYLKTTATALNQAGIESARLDALILLEDAMHQDRAILLAHPEHQIPAPIAAKLYKKRTQREQHIPLAYIRGHAPFFGREFAVTEHTLIPRPETEAMIELLKKHAPTPKITARSKHHLRIADIGTGSGILGITAGLELPGSQIDLYDISEQALKMAKQNAEHFKQPASCRQSDLLADLAELTEDKTKAVATPHDILLANLPYVPEIMQINQAAQHEPRIAIFSGTDGLNHYKTFWEQVSVLNHRPKLIITESLPMQHHANAMMARSAGYYLEEAQGFAQAFKDMDDSGRIKIV